MRRIIDKFWLVLKFETCRPRPAGPVPWGSSWKWQTCRRRWLDWWKCRQNTFLNFVIYLYSGYVIKIALHWPEEALAGAHQGGELEVVRAKDHLEGRYDLFYAVPKVGLPIQQRQSRYIGGRHRWGSGACWEPLPTCSAFSSVPPSYTSALPLLDG